MPIADHDPRVFFAAERTLLAWLRTGLTLMALGFVIARFGLFLQLLSVQAPGGRPPGPAWIAAALGIIFVLAGALASLVATIQHRRFVSNLSQIDLPQSYSGTFGAMFGFFIGLVGLVLALYLGISET